MIESMTPSFTRIDASVSPMRMTRLGGVSKVRVSSQLFTFTGEENAEADAVADGLPAPDESSPWEPQPGSSMAPTSPTAVVASNGVLCP